ncbi:MAG: hypothetical protein KAU38_08295, partial [Desulfobacterales bacterium]|nr:hypothetical protein [Desulfobacterales bacterium]
ARPGVTSLRQAIAPPTRPALARQKLENATGEKNPVWARVWARGATARIKVLKNLQGQVWARGKVNDDLLSLSCRSRQGKHEWRNSAK